MAQALGANAGGTELNPEEQRLRRHPDRHRELQTNKEQDADDLTAKLQKRSSQLYEQRQRRVELLQDIERLRLEVDAHIAESDTLRWRTSSLRSALRTAEERTVQDSCELKRIGALLSARVNRIDHVAWPEGCFDRRASLNELQTMLEALLSHNVCEDILSRCGPFFALILCTAWSAAFANLALIAHWSIPLSWTWFPLIAQVSMSAALLGGGACRAEMLKQDELRCDEYDIDIPLLGSLPPNLADEAELLPHHIDTILRTFAQSSCASWWSSQIVGLSCLCVQVTYLVLFAALRPSECMWLSMGTQNAPFGEFEPVASGLATCALGRINVAAWLICCLPFVWVLTWRLCATFVVHKALVAVRMCVLRREDLLVSPSACGQRFLALALERFWSITRELVFKRRFIWWAAWQLLVNGIDCVELWFTLVADGLVLAAVAPPSAQVESTLEGLWPCALIVLALGAISVVSAPFLQSSFSWDELPVFEDSRQQLFMRFMAFEIGMPTHNKKALWRAIQSLFTIELPFFVLRAVATICTRSPASSVMVVKNVFCASYYFYILFRFRLWQCRARALRSRSAPHRSLLDALDKRCVCGDAGDQLLELEEEFLEVYLEDVFGIPLAAAGGAGSDVLLTSAELTRKCAVE